MHAGLVGDWWEIGGSSHGNLRAYVRGSVGLGPKNATTCTS